MSYLTPTELSLEFNRLINNNKSFPRKAGITSDSSICSSRLGSQQVLRLLLLLLSQVRGWLVQQVTLRTWRQR